MSRVSGVTVELHRQITTAGVSMTLVQLQKARDRGLGPVDGCQESVGHWRAVAGLAGGTAQRLPDANEAAVLLAEQGWPCRRLPDALAVLLDEQRAELDAVPLGKPGPASNPYAETASEAAARHMVERVGGHEGEPTLLDSFARRAVAGSTTAGDPWPEIDDQEAESLHYAGRVLAVLGELGEAADNPAQLREVDAEDLSAVLGGVLDSSSVQAGLNLGAMLGAWVPFGPRAAEALTSTDTAVLASAVQAAAALVPLLTALGVAAPRGRRDRLRLVAMVVPMVLGLGELVAAEHGASAVGPLHDELVELVDGSPERLAHYQRASSVAALPGDSLP